MKLHKENIKKIQKHERKVIMELYAYTFDIMMLAVCRYKQNDEDKMELINSSFLKIVQNIHQFKIGSNYFAWVKTIVNRVIIDDFRKNKSYKSLFIYDGKEHRENDDYIDFNNEMNENITSETALNLLNKLPPATKLVFNLYALEDYTAKEVAKELGIKYETVKWHVKEARKKLKLLVEVQNLTEIE